MTIGERVKIRREELDITQVELAKRMGYKTRAAISKIEISGNKISLKTISKLADALNCSETYLMGFDAEDFFIEAQNEEAILLEMYRKMDGSGRKLMMKFAKSYLEDE